MHLIFSFLVLLCIIHPTLFASNNPSKQNIDIGIISFRPIAENQQIWQPLADELNRLEPQYNYRIHSYKEIDLEKAVALNKLDFMVVHSLSYVTMETKYNAQNIASIIRQDDQKNNLPAMAV